MKFATILATFTLSAIAPMQAAEKKAGSAEIEHTAVVESGTYRGVAHKVDADEKEIYVRLDGGKVIELYLKGHTELTQGGKPAKFDALKEGQKIEVRVEKKGNRLNPLAVNILE